MSGSKTLRLTALDTLFFREARPFDAIGGSELASVFPPPPRTVLGAVRTTIGDTLGADWKRFHDEKENYVLPNGQKLCEVIGYGDKLGPLALHDIWLSLNEERLYPAPLFLLHKQEEDKDYFERLHVGTAVQTHIGTVHLPEALGRNKGYKPLEEAWLTRVGMEEVLKGNMPDNGDLYREDDLFAKEPRLGIARDNSKRTVEKSLLYQTCHIRPKKGLAIGADIFGLNGMEEIKSRVVRLGGEGRMASISLVDTPTPLAKPGVEKGKSMGLILIFLTPARFQNKDGNPHRLPTGFISEKENGADVWKGEINGIALTAYAAVLGKAQREGGWNVAERKPRDVQSLIPPGSSYYCRVENGNLDAAIDALHGVQIGEDQQLGRGKIVCGLWNQKEFSTDHQKGAE